MPANQRYEIRPKATNKKMQNKEKITKIPENKT